MEVRESTAHPDILARLAPYSQSNCRLPDVFVFNPFAEACLAEGRAFNPTRHQAGLAADLQNLPQFLSHQGDIVLVHRIPSREFLNRVQQAGFPRPEFIELNPSAIRALANRKLGALRPWAWASDSVELLQPLLAGARGKKCAAANLFPARLAELYSKSWSTGFLRQILRAHSHPWLCGENEVGLTVTSLPEARAAITAIRARGHHPLVVKKAFGVAGSNALRLLEPAISSPQWTWMDRAFQHRIVLVIEPWLKRVRDFSIQMEMTLDGLKLCGFTGLLNDARGQFIANYAESQWPSRFPARITSLFGKSFDFSQRLREFYEDVFARLETELHTRNFSGPIGLDAFVYRDAMTGLRLKPIVEINPRYTMGRLLLELLRQASPGGTGILRLVNAAQIRTAGFTDFPSFARSLEVEYPLKSANLSGSPNFEGALCLNEPAAAQTVLAVFRTAHDPGSFLPL